MKVVVLGSLFTDIAARAPRLPSPGETVIGTDLDIAPGGKGFNQAAAAAAAGAAVHLVSRVGDDTFGNDLLRACDRAGVDRSHVTLDITEGTGVGLPVTDADGENAIVVVPRAASRLRPADAERARAVIADADMLLLQLEVPIAASLAAARLAVDHGTEIVLNAAPADAAPTELLIAADHLVVNEHEAALLLGRRAALTAVAATDAADELRTRLGLRSVIVTLGPAGAAWSGGGGTGHVPGHAVDVIDTVGAGDAFCGYLAATLATGAPIEAAVRAGNAAGALTVTARGAQPAIPAADRVAELARTGATEPSFISLEGNR